MLRRGGKEVNEAESKRDTLLVFELGEMREYFDGGLGFK